MSNRQLRTRKQPKASRTPTILDDIHVCWELNGCTLWWPATVVQIYDYDTPRKDLYGEGTLLYKRFRGYPEEHADVQFIYRKRGGHLLLQKYNNDQLIMSWSFEPQAVEDEKSPATSSHGRDSTSSPQKNIPAKRRGDSVPKRQPKRSSSRSEKTEDTELPTNVSVGRDSQHDQTGSVVPSSKLAEGTSAAVSLQNETEATAAAANIKTAVNGPMSGLTSAEGQPDFVGVQADLFEKTASKFFNAILATSQDIVQTKQGIMCSMSGMDFHDQLTQLVMHELRIDLVQELHRHFKTPQTMIRNPSDLQQRTLKTSVSCPLHTFSKLAAKIRGSLPGSAVHFFPSYEQTQNPSISTERFTIYFTSVHSLSAAIGFNDDRDFETLFFREKCYDSTYYARIIGSLSPALSASPHECAAPPTNRSSSTLVEKKTCTSASIKHQHEHAEVPPIKDTGSGGAPSQAPAMNEVDVIYVGLSQTARLTKSMNDHTSSGSTTGVTDENAPSHNSSASALGLESARPSPAEVPMNCIALVRRCTLWDEETHSYLSQWGCHRDGIIISPPNDEFFSSKTKKLDGVFALRWEQKYIPRTNAWTSDAFRSDNHILGKLEVIIPWVLLTGDQCVEVGDIVSKETFRIR